MSRVRVIDLERKVETLEEEVEEIHVILKFLASTVQDLNLLVALQEDKDE